MAEKSVKYAPPQASLVFTFYEIPFRPEELEELTMFPQIL